VITARLTKKISEDLYLLALYQQYSAENLQRNLVVSNDETLSYAGRVHSISFAGQDHSTQQVNTSSETLP